jgi:hypothetical protein
LSINQHDIHEFVVSSQRAIEEEYARIRKRAAEDPGTAGDQGEENWATLLRIWLPSYFHIVTKGRILTDSGYASPQVDVIVLFPSYPKILLDKKLYLSGGVAAAFECKTTLNTSHIQDAVKTAAEIRRNLPKRQGTPFKELNSTIIYGLLAHSHSWKRKTSKPIENIEGALLKADELFTKHPLECIDLITIADLVAWDTHKVVYHGPNMSPWSERMAEIYGPNGSASTSYCRADKWQENQKEYFSPIGVLLSSLYSMLAWNFPDMRYLEEYFRKVNLLGCGIGQMRLWDLEIYSEPVRSRVSKGLLSNGSAFDEWSLAF